VTAALLPGDEKERRSLLSALATAEDDHARAVLASAVERLERAALHAETERVREMFRRRVSS